MASPKSFFRIFTESGPLIAVAVATALLLGVVGPASAQFFNFGGPPRPQAQPRSGGFGGGWFGGDLFAPFQQQQAPKRIREDFSRAPPPEKRETVPDRNVLVLGDGMADWLAYGLEDAYSEQPDMGVIRKAKTYFGPDQVSAQGRARRLGRRGQRHPRHREARRHRRHARAQRPDSDARAGRREIRRQGRRQEDRQEGRPRQAGGETRHGRRRGQAGRQGGRCRIAPGRCRRQWRCAAGHRAGKERALAERAL